MSKAKSKAKDIASVKQDGPVWRVVDADGVPLAGQSTDSDGGGFRDKRDADHMAATINERAKADG